MGKPPGPDPRRPVPCAGCTACCQRDAVRLHPAHGDDLTAYQTEQDEDGYWCLAHKPNGDCVYLDRAHGCTIHERAPWSCQQFDCRALLDLPRIERRRLVAFGYLSRELLKAAKACRARS